MKKAIVHVKHCWACPHRMLHDSAMVCGLLLDETWNIETPMTGIKDDCPLEDVEDTDG